MGIRHPRQRACRQPFMLPVPSQTLVFTNWVFDKKCTDCYVESAPPGMMWDELFPPQPDLSAFENAIEDLDLDD